MSELKPCPFCGGDTVMIPGYETDGKKTYVPNWFVAKCCNCYCMTAKLYTEQDAISAWNKRHERTCHAVDKHWEQYEPEPSHGFLEARCDACGEYIGWRDYSHVGEYCHNCGAKVVN
jgi:Lar family restriction alleviation protein